MMSTENGRTYYNNLHNSKLSKQMDNLALGYMPLIALPVAVEYDTIVLIKYGADVIMQAAISKNLAGEYQVNFINAAIGSVVPAKWNPIVYEASQMTQDQLNGDGVNLQKSIMKIGTGYIGHGIGKLGEGMSVLGDKVTPFIQEGLQSFHSNLQSVFIDKEFNSNEKK